MSENTENKFGNRLRELVRKKFSSYQSAADDFDISISYLQQLMRGERSPSFEMLEKLALKLGADELLLSEEKRNQLKLAKETAEVIEEKRKRRSEFLAWELNLDESNKEDVAKLHDLIVILPHLKNIPADILLMMSQQNEAYFKSVRSVLLKKSEKKTDKKLVRKKG